MWCPLPAFGFAYYEAYDNNFGFRVAWISRQPLTNPYRYFAFYCDGKHRASATRGSMVNARKFIAGPLKKYGAE